MFADEVASTVYKPVPETYTTFGRSVRSLRKVGGSCALACVLPREDEVNKMVMMRDVKSTSFFDGRLSIETAGVEDSVVDTNDFCVSVVECCNEGSVPQAAGESWNAWQSLDPKHTHQVEVGDYNLIACRLQNQKESGTQKGGRKICGYCSGVVVGWGLQYTFSGGCEKLTFPMTSMKKRWIGIFGKVEERKGENHVFVESAVGFIYLCDEIQQRYDAEWLLNGCIYGFTSLSPFKNPLFIEHSQNVLGEMVKLARATGRDVVTKGPFIGQIAKPEAHKSFGGILHVDCDRYVFPGTGCNPCGNYHVLHRVSEGVGPAMLGGTDLRLKTHGGSAVEARCLSQFIYSSAPFYGMGPVDLDRFNGLPKGGDQYLGRKWNEEVRFDGSIGLRAFEIDGVIRVSSRFEVQSIDSVDPEGDMWVSEVDDAEHKDLDSSGLDGSSDADIDGGDKSGESSAADGAVVVNEVNEDVGVPESVSATVAAIAEASASFGKSFEDLDEEMRTSVAAGYAKKVAKATGNGGGSSFGRVVDADVMVGDGASSVVTDQDIEMLETQPLRRSKRSPKKRNASNSVASNEKKSRKKVKRES